jgi:hypothetical protein
MMRTAATSTPIRFVLRNGPDDAAECTEHLNGWQHFVAQLMERI